MKPGEATRVVSFVCGLLVLEGCGQDCFWQPTETVALGVSADLEDVAAVSGGSYLAVGAQGTVVKFGQVQDGRHIRWTSESLNVTQVDLHAVTSARDRDEWWVVGDGGFAAVSRDSGDSWIQQELGTTADLYAVQDYYYAEDGSMIIVGDDVVLLRNPGGSWQEEPPPMDGWGSLRDARPGYDTFVIGLGGVAWGNWDINGPDSSWEAMDTGTSSDLLKMTKENSEGVDEFWAFASDGTNLHYDGDFWQPIDSGPEIVVVDVDKWRLLTDDGIVYEFSHRTSWDDLVPLPPEFPGARALATPYGGGHSIGVVGDHGFAAAARYVECNDYW